MKTRVVLLSQNPERVGDIFKDDVMTCQPHNGPIPECDYVVSYGHRHILKGDILDRYKDRIINVHIGFLPWNRGSDPNFWSWHDNSPKGVTIHYIDSGVDTGDIIEQFKVRWLHPERETLESTYNHLQDHAKELLRLVWSLAKNGELKRKKQVGEGSYHKSADMKNIRLPSGWKTPVQYVEDLGKQVRGEGNDRR